MSVVHIPLYLGCPVPLPLTRALVVRGCAARVRIISARKCVGLARAPGQLESSHSAPMRRAVRSGEIRDYPVVFGLPCPSAFTRAHLVVRGCAARVRIISMRK